MWFTQHIIFWATMDTSCTSPPLRSSNMSRNRILLWTRKCQQWSTNGQSHKRNVCKNIKSTSLISLQILNRSLSEDKLKIIERHIHRWVPSFIFTDCQDMRAHWPHDIHSMYMCTVPAVVDVVVYITVQPLLLLLLCNMRGGGREWELLVTVGAHFPEH